MNKIDPKLVGGQLPKFVTPNVPKVNSPKVETRPDGLNGSGQHHGVPDLLDKTGIENNGQRNTIAPHAPERAPNNGQRSKIDPDTVSSYLTSFRYPGKK